MDSDAWEKAAFLAYFVVFVGTGIFVPMGGWLQTVVTLLLLFTVCTTVYLVVLRLVDRSSSSPSELD